MLKPQQSVVCFLMSGNLYSGFDNCFGAVLVLLGSGYRGMIRCVLTRPIPPPGWYVICVQ